PGQGARRAGDDMEAGRSVLVAGQKLGAADLLVARRLGLGEVAVRAPRLRVLDIAAERGETATAHFIAALAASSGASVADIETVGRDANSIGGALERAACDLLVLIGGTGAGRTDATADGLHASGALIAHNIALQPGRTTAIGRLAATPVAALPGA